MPLGFILKKVGVGATTDLQSNHLLTSCKPVFTRLSYKSYMTNHQSPDIFLPFLPIFVFLSATNGHKMVFSYICMREDVWEALGICFYL